MRPGKGTYVDGTASCYLSCLLAAVQGVLAAVTPWWHPLACRSRQLNFQMSEPWHGHGHHLCGTILLQWQWQQQQQSAWHMLASKAVQGRLIEGYPTERVQV